MRAICPVAQRRQGNSQGGWLGEGPGRGVEAELAGALDQYDPELIQGVRVLWVREGRAARDETAFRHALKAGHRLRQAGQRVTDAAIIDAYERGYRVAQEVGADGRKSELPPMKDRQTMARRVRGTCCCLRHMFSVISDTRSPRVSLLPVPANRS